MTLSGRWKGPVLAFRLLGAQARPCAFEFHLLRRRQVHPYRCCNCTVIRNSVTSGHPRPQTCFKNLYSLAA